MFSAFRISAGALLTLSLGLAAAAFFAPGASSQYQQPPTGMPGMPGGMPGGMSGMQGGMPGAMMLQFTQVVLTDDDILNFVASFPKLEALGDKYDSQIGRQALIQNPAAFSVPPAALAELNAVLSEYGFDSVEHWQNVAYSTVMAHSQARTGTSPMQQIDEAIAQIKANPQMPEQQKAMVIAQMEAQRGMMAAYQALPENVERVARFGAEIEAALGN